MNRKTEVSTDSQVATKFGVPASKLLPFADAVYFIALGITVLATVVSIVAGFMQNRLGARISDQKDRELRAYQLESGREIASANERAGAANERAESARLEQERMKVALAWRVLAPDVRESIAKMLANRGGTVTLGYIQNDPEFLSFAFSIVQAFDGANGIAGRRAWEIVPEPRVYADQILYGLYISGPDTELVGAVRAIFSFAKVPFSPQETPNQGVRLGTSFATGPTPLTTQALIIVGSKMPPF